MPHRGGNRAAGSSSSGRHGTGAYQHQYALFPSHSCVTAPPPHSANPSPGQGWYGEQQCVVLDVVGTAFSWSGQVRSHCLRRLPSPTLSPRLEAISWFRAGVAGPP